MKQAIAIKWAEMLESGLVPQAYATNRNEKGLCVTSVLNNLHATLHPKIAATQTNPKMYLGCDYGVAKDVMEWSGIKTGYGAIGGGPRIKCGNGSYDTLMSANDTGHARFTTLAKYIRENWMTL